MTTIYPQQPLSYINWLRHVKYTNLTTNKAKVKELFKHEFKSLKVWKGAVQYINELENKR